MTYIYVATCSWEAACQTLKHMEAAGVSLEQDAHPMSSVPRAAARDGLHLALCRSPRLL